jgi:two-component sensor histidine kinase/CheY-like chemotaxis protein
MPKNVLYADDDAGLRRLVELGLGRDGIRVVTVEHGEAALEALGRESFDVVALDHYMPVLDGLSTLERIQAMPVHPPVVIVTGAQESRIAVAALKAGAFDYVTKDAQGEFIPLLKNAMFQAAEAMRLRRAKEAAESEVRAARDRAEALAEERAVLLREVNHRVGNSLQLIAAFLNLQAGGSDNPDVKAALTDAMRRVMAVAQVHKRLYMSGDVQSVPVDQYLIALIEDLAQTTGQITLAVEPLEIDPDRAVAIGVIVNELVLNALKYAYPDNGGPIRVGLKRANGKRAVLSVEDDGIGHDINVAPKSTGLGQKIVAAMASKLGAKLFYDPAHTGTRILISFDVASPDGERPMPPA